MILTNSGSAVRRTQLKTRAAAGAKPREDDPMLLLWQSRDKEREALLKMRLQLDKLIADTQRRILEMRAKGNLARQKLYNKANN